MPGLAKTRINLGTGDGRRADWRTPRWLFDLLCHELPFTLDVCATHANRMCPAFISEKEDGLAVRWNPPDTPGGNPGAFWMNPPYGQKELPLWMTKAWRAAALHGHAGACLVPARTDARWWHEFAMKGEIRFVRGRVGFDDGYRKAPFASAVIIFRPTPAVESSAYVLATARPSTIESPSRRRRG